MIGIYIFDFNQNPTAEIIIAIIYCPMVGQSENAIQYTRSANPDSIKINGNSKTITVDININISINLSILNIINLIVIVLIQIIYYHHSRHNHLYY